LTELIATIKEASKEHSYMELNADLFEETITEWKKYRDKKAELNASVVEGGSMYPTIFASSLTTTTKEKIESLKNEYEIDLRRYASR
jgi:uncharacterized protein YecT (DUF1311 family)